MGEAFKKAENKSNNLAKLKGGLEKELQAKGNDLGRLGKELSSAKAKANDLEGALKRGNDQNDKLKKLLEDKNAKLAQALVENAKLRAAPGYYKTTATPGTGNGSMRSTIAKNLSKRFEAMGADVLTDKKTGSITLFIGEAFLFYHDSYKLKEKIKNKLKTIIPVYTEELFKDQTIRSNIASVNILGHASPYYYGYIDPEKASYEAYEYNLTLSANRALEINKYIIGENIGKYKYKNIMRNKAKSSGVSFNTPILLDKSKEKANNKCGAYSCRRSRRVEISFTLANENAAMKFVKSSLAR